jgi:hypothetical protein
MSLVARVFPERRVLPQISVSIARVHDMGELRE